MPTKALLINYFIHQQIWLVYLKHGLNQTLPYIFYIKLLHLSTPVHTRLPPASFLPPKSVNISGQFCDLLYWTFIIDNWHRPYYF